MTDTEYIEKNTELDQAEERIEQDEAVAVEDAPEGGQEQGGNAQQDDAVTEDDAVEEQEEDEAAAEIEDDLDDEEEPHQVQAFSDGEMLGREETRRVLYALLFVSDRPLSASRLAEVIGDIDKHIVENLLEELREEISKADVPFELHGIAGGYQLMTKEEFSPHIRTLLQIKKSNRLSKAVLETLAIIAYKQPVTRSQVEAIRGVSVSHAFEILQSRHLIKVIGVAELPGRPRLYKTTDEFLHHFGMKNLKELPTIEELRGIK